LNNTDGSVNENDLTMNTDRTDNSHVEP